MIIDLPSNNMTAKQAFESAMRLGLWEAYKDCREVEQVVYEGWVIATVKIQLLEKYAKENPTTETCEMLDILNANMSYGQAKDKLKELDGGKYDIIGYGFSYEEKQDDN